MASSEPRTVLLLAGLLCGCAHVGSAPPPENLTLQSTRGDTVSLPQLLARSDATVFVFWSEGCPCVRRYQDRVNALAAAWAERGVSFVEVSSNAGESLESLRAAERQRSLPRPLWRDEGGLLAARLEARSTPTVVLVRRDGKVLYRGWLDNERLPGEDGREAWLEQALQAFATGGSAQAKSPTWGCTITRSLRASVAPQCHVPTSEVADSASSSPSPGGTP